MVNAAYPTGKRTFTEKVDVEDIVLADHVNLLQAEVRAMQDELGLTPSSSFSDVAAYLANLNTVKYEDGRTLKAAAGSLAAPGLGFSTEAGLGLARVAPGVVALVAGSAERLRASNSGISLTDMNVTGTLTVSGSAVGLDHGATGGKDDDDHTQYSRVDGLRPFTNPIGGVTPTAAAHLTTKSYVDARIPAGTIVFTARSSAPAGWLLCNGQAVSRATYAELFAALDDGTIHGTGDGSTTFNLPDMRQRFPLHKAGTGTGSTLGSKGGSIDHSHSNPSTSTEGNHAHSNPNVNSNGSHNHSVSGTTSTNGSHRHDRAGIEASSWTVAGSPLYHMQNDGSHSHSWSDTSSSNGSHAHSQGNTGSGGSHSHTQGSTGTNNPPYIVLNAMIRT